MNLGSLYQSALGFAGVAGDIAAVFVDSKRGFTPKGNVANVWYFDILGEEVVSVNSDITDHYVEDNTSMQDHIALKPETITVGAYHGEITNILPAGSVSDLIQATVKTASAVSSYVPTLSTTALRAYNTAFRVYQAAERAVSYYQQKAGIKGSNQSEAFKYFYTAWQNRQLFSVQTPFRTFDSMAILSLRATQSENDRFTSDFQITFKRFRVATTQTVARNNKGIVSTTPTTVGVFA